MYAQRKAVPITHNGEKLKAPQEKALSLIKLNDQQWRLNNLYHIVDKHGKLVKFRLNRAQRRFLKRMWYRNVILKSRQLGFTTFIDLFLLDKVLFIPNMKAVIIAHRQEDAAEILEAKVRKPYANLHPAIRESIQLVESNKSTMKFSNGSSIMVTVSGRSGTANLLHISELGYTANHRPDVADEIITGSLPAVHGEGFVFIESTAKGSSGPFYDICQNALSAHRERKRLTKMDFRFHFFAWFEEEMNRVEEHEVEYIEIVPRLQKYFDALEKKLFITLDPQQRAWYASQEAVYEDRMKRENPSTPEEAFANATERAYFKTQMNYIREREHIGKLPYQHGRLVHTYWDIGIGDATAVWFIQQVGGFYHALYYYEERDKSIGECIQEVKDIGKDKGWILGSFVGPHDLEHRRQAIKGRPISLKDQLDKIGVEFVVVKRVTHKTVSIDVARRMISSTRFDEIGCQKGIERLENYQKKWDQKHGIPIDEPVHDANADGADAFQTFGLAVETEEIEKQTLGKARKQDVSLFETPTQAHVDDTQVQPHVVGHGHAAGGRKPPKRNTMRAYT